MMKKIIGWGVGLIVVSILQAAIAYGVLTYLRPLPDAENGENRKPIEDQPPIQEIVCPPKTNPTFNTTNAQLFALLRHSSAKADITEAHIKEELEKGQGTVIFFGENGFQGNFLIRGSHDQDGYLFSESKMPDNWHKTINSFLFFAPEAHLQLLRLYDVENFSGQYIRFCGSSFVSEMDIFDRVPYKIGIAGEMIDSFMFEEM